MEVIVNIEKLFAQGVPELPTISTPTDPTSVTSPADVKEIQVSSHTNPANALTSWTVPDNGFASGYLNNGKPITRENVLELLAEAEKIWPSGMAWGERNNVENGLSTGAEVKYPAKLSIHCWMWPLLHAGGR